MRRDRRNAFSERGRVSGIAKHELHCNASRVLRYERPPRRCAVARARRQRVTMGSGRFTFDGRGTQCTVIKRILPPDKAQRCEVCELLFPAKEAGDWLRYYRAVPPAGPEAA